jgi:dienelactone hydrolase
VSADKVVAERLVGFSLRLPQVVTRPPLKAWPARSSPRLPGKDTRPALILLGGSEGGSQDHAGRADLRLARLRRAGASLLLASRLGPERAGAARAAGAAADLRRHPGRAPAAGPRLAGPRSPRSTPARIGVVGTSKGAEFALLAATRMPWVRSVVAWVPSDVVWEGWGPGTEPGRSSSFSWQGKPLPFVPYRGMAEELAGFQTGAAVRLRRPQDAGRAAHPERIAAARIPVEDFAGPLMVIGGHADQVWDSGGMAEQIADRRRQAGRETVTRVFRDAGHYLGSHGWGPTTQYDAGPMKGGGTPQANAHAQAESWRALFDFLARTLGPLPPR